MSNLIIFLCIFLILLIIFIKTFRSFTSQLYLRRKIKKGLRQNKSEIYEARGNKQQLFEIHKRVYNYVTYRPNRLIAPMNRRKFEQKANNELNRMVRNPFTKLFSAVLTFSKGVFAFAFLVATVFSGAIVVDEVKASSLTLPTINKDTQLKLNVDLEDKIDSLVTYLLNSENKMKSFNFQELANEAVIPVYDVKDYPQAVTNVEQLGQAIAHHMSQFENRFTVYYEGESADFESIVDQVYTWLQVNEPYLWAVMGDFSTRAKSYGNTIEWQATVNYDLTAEENAIVLGKIEQIINTVPQGATEAEKVKFVNDYLVVHTKYNLDSKANPHTPYSILVNGEGVCEGYALAALLMLEALHIEAKYVVGNAGGPHAWNLVKVDGQWYHLDTTWNDPLPDQGEKVHYQYFLITDEKMSDDHEWIESDYPKTAINNYL
ncbi:transglutaminase domain-containing protein [Solibacillus silvestris]|uniref:transglutaminase domain-containing protein n=1 Tax=Solibacillus silvestris TaxID=76853 RepID=UPI003F7F9F0D